MSAAYHFLGVDIGSTTLKVVVVDRVGALCFSRYTRHLSEIRNTALSVLSEVRALFADTIGGIAFTGSGAIALAEELGLPFVQEVVASALAIQQLHPEADVSIELGGEDAKLTFFSGGLEQRMNETCAGGTGAFIDQMAAFIQTDPVGLDALARQHTVVYPIASRCGVFAKTDILPLLNEGCERADIAASIMQAVVNQTISGLARGRDITGTVVFLGGPLAFLPSLRERFAQTLQLPPEQAVFPDHAEYFVALGAALSALNACRKKTHTPRGHDLHALLRQLAHVAHSDAVGHLPPLFACHEERQAFSLRHSAEKIGRFPLQDYEGDAWLGIDSGSTTIKAALVDDAGRLLYSSYGPNHGDPLQAGLGILRDINARRGAGLRICGAAVTGYGSALVRAGIRADIDEVETVAHCTGAQFFLPAVESIIDIGGQDIKCMHIRSGVIDRIQLNEACSAGCGSFIESFAASLRIALPDFVEEALRAASPVDLGTRCTVFMNSKVKQAQKDGAAVGDIAAGLAYSVIRNACYKVMKLSSLGSRDELGNHVVAQGGAFMNDALLRTLELHLGRHVVRPDIAGLMGAFGAALIARERCPHEHESSLVSAGELAAFSVRTSTARCRHCANACLLTVTHFSGGQRFISGNRCEKGVGNAPSTLPNLYAFKYQRLFSEYEPLAREHAPRGVIGMPRALNMYENYPFWFTIFTHLGYRVELSSPSDKELFCKGYSTIPSQTVCYPAKLAHGHILDLLERGVDAIFFPCIPFEQRDFSGQTGSYNCPVVIGYPELLAKNINAFEKGTGGIPFIHPFLPLSGPHLIRRLRETPFFARIPVDTITRAVQRGFEEMRRYKFDIAQAGEKALVELERSGRFGIVLAGHPYHVDPEVHHGIAELITSCGAAVLTEDSIAHLLPDPGPLRVVDQWTYHARLYRAGAYAAATENLAVLQLLSFGCGLDAITADQLEEIVTVKGRLYAQIKVDEGANLGAARIRIRSLLAAMRALSKGRGSTARAPADPVYKSPPPFTEAMRDTHTILIPQLSPAHFQFLETIFTTAGYRVKQLPHVDRAAIELGLRHVNNDACFPAIVVVGQLLQAVRSKVCDPNAIALMISETGGGCRATNYIAFLRKALADSGLEHIPIISLSTSPAPGRPGFRLSGPLLRRIIMAGYYGDVLMRVTQRLTPYEKEPGSVQALVGQWVERCKRQLAGGNIIAFDMNIFRMVKEFDQLPLSTETRKPRVGLVGEILLKYHPDANNRAAEIIMEEGGEAVLPDLMDFAMYSFYDPIFNHKYLGGRLSDRISGFTGIAFLELCRWSLRVAFGKSKRFTAPVRFKELRGKVAGLVSLGHQTGEGWLLVAEMVKLLESGASAILCMQPFGCLPNHITGKGFIKELKRRFPHATIVALDYDPGASEVNQINRIKLMMAGIDGGGSQPR